MGNICPRCEIDRMKDPIEHNAISSEDEKTYICSICGNNESKIIFMRAKGHLDRIPKSQFEMQNKFREKLGLGITE